MVGVVRVGERKSTVDLFHVVNNLSLDERRVTYQHSETHDRTTCDQSNPTPKTVDDHHLNDCAPNLQRRLNATSHERHAMGQPKLREQCGKVVLHGRSTAHLSHKLQQRRPPKAVKEIPLRKQRHPSLSRGLVHFNALFDLSELDVRLAICVRSGSEVSQVRFSLSQFALLDQPAWSLWQEWQPGHKDGRRDVLQRNREPPSNVFPMWRVPEADAVANPKRKGYARHHANVIHNHVLPSLAGRSNLALVQWDRSRYDGEAKARDDAADDHHGVGAMAGCTCLESRANACYEGSGEGRKPPSEIVTRGLRKKDIGQPCPEVVDGRDEACVGGIGMVEGDEEAWID